VASLREAKAGTAASGARIRVSATKENMQMAKSVFKSTAIIVTSLRETSIV
jgi:hypothetical protein